MLILLLNELINTINNIDNKTDDYHSIRSLVMDGTVDNNSNDLLNIILLNS